MHGQEGGDAMSTTCSEETTTATDVETCARCGRIIHGDGCGFCEGADLTLWEVVLVFGAVLMLAPFVARKIVRKPRGKQVSKGVAKW